jgi:aspartyl/asparaginyl-tRNA synthetase
MRASTLRLEAFIGKVLQEFQNQLKEEIKKVNADMACSNWEIQHFPRIEFDQALKALDKAMFKKALGLFRNPKAFFEKNEKKAMSDALEQLLQHPADEYLRLQNDLLKHQYTEAMKQFFKALLDDYTEQVKEYYVGVESALTVDYRIDNLKDIFHSIKDQTKEV